jgi:hypothetical protein
MHWCTGLKGLNDDSGFDAGDPGDPGGKEKIDEEDDTRGDAKAP